MNLCVQIRKHLKTIDIDLSFMCRPGEILAIVGPSGAGKSTVLRSVAGLEAPDSGSILFDHKWFDSRDGVNICPQKRRVGYLSQGYNLFPHLNIEKNIAFSAKDRFGHGKQ